MPAVLGDKDEQVRRSVATADLVRRELRLGPVWPPCSRCGHKPRISGYVGDRVFPFCCVCGEAVSPVSVLQSSRRAEQ